MKNILFATDFSMNAEKAFEYALNLARRHGSVITMLHVFDIATSWDFPDTVDSQEMEKQEIRESEKKMDQLLHKHTGMDEAMSFNFMVLKNQSVVQGILEGIEKSKAEMVVIGNKGAGKIKELLMGSTAKALLSRSPIPVLAIPENIRHFELSRVLFTSDFQKEDIRALQLCIQLLATFKPEVHVVHVNPTFEVGNQELIQYFKSQVHDLIDYPFLKFEILYDDNTAKSLIHFIEQNNIDFLVMLEKSRQGFLDFLFHPDLVKKMETQSHIPVLSFSEVYIQKPAIKE